MIPVVPTGCTLRSFVNATLYLRGEFFSSLARFPSIWAAQELAIVLLEGRQSTSWAAMRFTALPLVVSMLTEDRQSALLSNLAMREPIEVVMENVQAMMPRAIAQFRICRLCIEEDRLQYGLEFTRILHQIPAVRKCTTHDNPLENACGDCGEKYYFTGEKPRRRVLGRCRVCHSENGLSVQGDRSAGHAAFANLLARGLAGKAPEVRPDRLKVALDRFSDLSVVQGEDLLWMLSKFWGVDSWQKACSRIGAPPDEMRRSLLFGAPPQSVFGAYALASFFHSKIKTDSGLTTGDSINATIWSFMPSHKKDEQVFDKARRFGLPQNIALLLVRGDWITIRDNGYPLKSVRIFVGSLRELKDTVLDQRRMYLQHVRRLRRGIGLRVKARIPGDFSP